MLYKVFRGIRVCVAGYTHLIVADKESSYRVGRGIQRCFQEEEQE